MTIRDRREILSRGVTLKNNDRSGREILSSGEHQGADRAPRGSPCSASSDAARSSVSDSRLDDDALFRLRDQLSVIATVVIEGIDRRGPMDRSAGLDAALRLLPDDEHVDIEERAAIVEYDSGASRDEAERHAVFAVLRRRRAGEGSG